MNDEVALRRAIALAERARGWTWPNPMVGCVVVKDGEIVGEGWHRRAGEAHAEVEALRAAGDRARGATLLVNLEPCCHVGRTPPCTEAILKAGIRRVVFSMEDPDPRVHGGGLRRLRAAGVEVQGPVLEAEARRLNEAWIHHVRTGRPFVSVKAAQSLDGRTACHTGASQWITSEEARVDARRERSFASAVAVGSGTVLADDPRLSCRLDGAGPEPVRIVFDRRMRTPREALLFRSEGGPVWIVGDSRSERARALEDAGATVVDHAEHNSLEAQLRAFAARGVVHLFVEGGAALHGAFFDAGLVDRVLLYVAPVVIGGEGARPAVLGVGAGRPESGWLGGPIDHKVVGPDLRLECRRR